jgi:pyroglutamyl-peptidase
MRMLLTGFEPFGELQANPSQLIVERLAHGADQDLVVEVLPTEYAAAGARIRALIRDVRPEAVVCLGVAGRASAIRLERVALNLDDTEKPDNAGETPAGRPIAPGGPVGYWSTLPLAEMYAALQERDIPVQISNHAGTYVCNHVFYASLHEIERLGGGVPCGFIHVPLAAHQATTEEERERSLPLDTMVQAVGCCLEVLSAPPLAPTSAHAQAGREPTGC